MEPPKITLNNGRQMPPIGLGTWQVRDKTDCQRAIGGALEAGYRLIDTAQIYGNEQFVGEAIAQSSVPRDQLFITTKIWNNNQREDLLLPSLDQSLQNLQTEYVDLLLLHWPVTEYRRTAWTQMELAAKSGKAKNIGVSNYTIRHLEELLQNFQVKPVVNQVELHVFLQQPELVEFCKNNDIVLEAYSPLAQGHVDDPILAEIGKKHGKTQAQIMLRWCVQIGAVPIPKSIHQERIKENFGIFDFSLDNDDMKHIAKLDRNERTAWDPTNIQ